MSSSLRGAVEPHLGRVDHWLGRDQPGVLAQAVSDAVARPAAAAQPQSRAPAWPRAIAFTPSEASPARSPVLSKQGYRNVTAPATASFSTSSQITARAPWWRPERNVSGG